jgi:flagellar biosynthetic protein FliS
MSAQLAYLETEIATACPPKLRLVLIEAALRLANQAHSSGQHRSSHENGRTLLYLKRILLQLLMSMEHENHAVARQIKSVYRFLLSTVVDAELTGDTQRICDVEKVLQVERETWQMLTNRYLAEVAGQNRPPAVGFDGVA